MRRFRFLVLPLCIAAAAAAQTDDDYFQQFVQYTINVSLDTDRHWVTGTETIAYINNSPDTLRQFYLHLYPNAYKSRHSPFMRDYRRRFNINLIDVPKAYRGHLDITNVHINGVPVEVAVEGTIASMQIPQPLLPGEAMDIQLEFDGKVRKHAGRAGYRGDHYDFAQWYPKVVVYDENGFHPDQFMEGEFYGEFGTFDVLIDLPQRYVVAATGILAAGDPGWDYNPVGKGKGRFHGDDETERKTVHFHAERVHDFAWCADPTFVVQDTVWNDIDVRSVYRQKNASSWQDSTLAHAVRAMKWLDLRVGKYPYRQVAVVDALLGGGMEYPMLVMDGVADEGLVFHEIGHIYFYGILANDERAEAWLDEGFTEFQENWHDEKTYGPWGDRSKLNWYERMTPQHRIWEKKRNRIFPLARLGYGERVSTRSEEYDHSYYLHVYDKGSLTINAMKYALGDTSFQRVLHKYYDRWKLKHVNEDRFRSVVEEETETDLRLAFDQWLHTRKLVDYELSEVRTRETDDGVVVGVVIKRLGELFLPIQVDFTLEDGTIISRRIDGKLRTIKETFKLPAAPVQTQINPANEIMDIDASNNVLPRRRDWQFDWPNNYYYPEDAYQIRHRPGFWYNDVDGLKAGYHLSGSLHGWKRRIQLGLYYGAKSDVLDFKFQWEEPTTFLRRNTNVHLSGYRMEGRNDFDFFARIRNRSKLLEPPTQDFIIGYNYHELRDAAYLTSAEIYDTARADVGPYFGYRADPQVDFMATRFSLDFRLGRTWTWGEYEYERVETSLNLYSRRKVVPIDARFRFFAGYGGGDMPTQQKFQLAGGGPLQQEKRFWLRSPGAIWEDLNYHEPGDGNLRGFYAGTFGVNQLLSFNTEIGTRLPLGFLSKVLGQMSWYGFFDAGTILDSTNPIRSSERVQGLVDGGILEASLWDAGVGFRSNLKLPFWNLTYRFDMPFHVSHPEVNGEKEKSAYRYLFSLSATF